MDPSKKRLKRIKVINEELRDLTEEYQKNVLERTDELE
jgi:Zn-dependent oligopeptidase